jgi:hypothetical protein
VYFVTKVVGVFVRFSCATSAVDEKYSNFTAKRIIRTIQKKALCNNCSQVNCGLKTRTENAVGNGLEEMGTFDNISEKKHSRLTYTLYSDKVLFKRID